MSTQTFTRDHIIPQLVVWFNALSTTQRIVRPADVPFFNVKVIKDPNEPTLSNIVVGDDSVAADPENYLGEGTFTWVGARHTTLPQTATATDFYEVAKNVAPSSAWDGHELLRLGPYYLWVDTSDKLRMKKGLPTSDTDGTLVGE